MVGGCILRKDEVEDGMVVLKSALYDKFACVKEDEAVVVTVQEHANASCQLRIVQSKGIVCLIGPRKQHLRSITFSISDGPCEILVTQSARAEPMGRLMIHKITDQ